MATFPAAVFQSTYSRFVGEEQSGCRNWRGSVNHSGYGVIRRGSLAMLAHRASWILAFGDIPVDKRVLHKCDNPRCTNPAHLFLGTDRDNVEDMMRKGRHKAGNVRGDQHGRKKLTTLKVLEIRRLAANGIPRRHIAKRFGVVANTVSSIVRHATWSSHV